MVLLKDDMRKENKMCHFILIVLSVFTVIILISTLVSNDNYTMVIFYALVDFFVLYYYVLSKQYRLVITSEQVNATIFFRSYEISMSDIVGYSHKRQRKIELHEFELFTKEHVLKISTRYPEKFHEIMREHGIEQKAWKQKK